MTSCSGKEAAATGEKPPPTVTARRSDTSAVPTALKSGAGLHRDGCVGAWAASVHARGGAKEGAEGRSERACEATATRGDAQAQHFVQLHTAAGAHVPHALRLLRALLRGRSVRAGRWRERRAGARRSARGASKAKQLFPRDGRGAACACARKTVRGRAPRAPARRRPPAAGLVVGARRRSASARAREHTTAARCAALRHTNRGPSETARAR
jgi:hypothetical protein